MTTQETTKKKTRGPKALNRVTAYQTTDGRLFTDKAEYLKAQSELDYGANVKALVEENIGHEYAVEDWGGVISLDQDQIADWLLQNRTKVLAALNGKYVSTDKTKAE